MAAEDFQDDPDAGVEPLEPEHDDLGVEPLGGEDESVEELEEEWADEEAHAGDE
jgi:hypothetical protein